MDIVNFHEGPYNSIHAKFEQNRTKMLTIMT